MTVTEQTNPFVVLWRVMDQCNLACPFCAYDKRLAFPRAAVDPDEVRRMIDLLGDWQGQAGRPVVLSWLGGEPTLWDHFDEMTARAQAAGLTQSLTTNGTTLGSAKVRDMLADRMTEITLSVDAVGAQHEELRGWRGGFAKLEIWVPKLADAITAAGREVRLRTNVVLMHQTVKGFDALCDRLADWGVAQITFNQLGGRDRPEFFPAHRLTAEDVAAFQAALPTVRARMVARGVSILGGDSYVDRIASSAVDARLPISSCGVARDFLFIDEACRVAPCAFVEGYFGIKTHDIRTVADLAAVTPRLCGAQARRPADVCADCMSTQQFSKFAA